METKNSKLEELELPEVISPYKLSKVVSQLVGRYVREQMVYSYCNKGLIKASKNAVGKWEVSREDALQWLGKFVPKHTV